MARPVPLFIAVALAVLALPGCSDDDPPADGRQGQTGPVDVLPSGGQAPPAREQDLETAVRAADCTLASRRGQSRDHASDLAEPVVYPTNPPASGRRYELAASAWNSAPEPLGTGWLLTCERLGDPTFNALRAFRDRHRGQGPEPIP